MSAVMNGPVEPMVFRPQKQHVHNLKNICTDDECKYNHFTVPPVVPSFDEPCPDCRHTTKYVGCPRCPTCNGTGVVQRVWRAERQCRDEMSGNPWDVWCGVTYPQREGHETRLAVVSWYPVTVLPVVDGEADNDLPPGCLALFGKMAWHGGGMGWVGGSTEPWAADLEPGCVVAITGDEVRLDTPITHMIQPFQRLTGRGVAAPRPESVPLALSDGLNDVELAR